MTRKTLSTLRTEDNFGMFWEKVIRMANEVDVGNPVFPRRRKMPRRFEIGEAPPEFHSTPKDYYCQIYTMKLLT